MKSKGLKERERRMKAGINNAESEKEVGMKEVNCLKKGKEQGNEKERAGVGPKKDQNRKCLLKQKPFVFVQIIQIQTSYCIKLSFQLAF